MISAPDPVTISGVAAPRNFADGRVARSAALRLVERFLPQRISGRVALGYLFRFSHNENPTFHGGQPVGCGLRWRQAAQQDASRR